MNSATLTPYRMACLKRATQMLASLAALTAPRPGDLDDDLLTAQRLSLSEAQTALVSFVWGVLDEADLDANSDDDPLCPVCGSSMHATHAPYCERRDGTPIADNLAG